MKRNTLRWYGHVPRMREDRLTKKVCDSKRERGMLGGVDQLPPGRKELEFVEERVGRGEKVFEKASEVCKDKMAWRHFCHGHPPLGSSREGTGVGDID
ncbi:hypothetical protein Hamer_G029073 [Homarus americanus]|uniref:Uncharacterized protein n=1 Tax=Homarus americanus TaxID=6706 RepID=A0A8J5JMI9_HOMAM|nr:hypothetical protein Hamer_G029073 [Homarus americanus]